MYTSLLLLIEMLWYGQAIFKSKRVKLSSSAVMQDSKLGSLRHQSACRSNAHSQTDWAIEEQAKTWTQQPVPMMISVHSAHWTSLPITVKSLI